MRRLFVLTTLFALGFGSLFAFAPRAQALPQEEIETIYFADDGSGVEVGGSIRFCNGYLYTYGQTSQYKAKYKGEPCGSNAPEYCVKCYQGTTRISCSAAEFNPFNPPECP